MLFNELRFQPYINPNVLEPWKIFGAGSTASLDLSDASASAGTLLAGKGVDLHATIEGRLSFANPTSGFLGFLSRSVDAYGTTSTTVQRNSAMGLPQIVPVKKGLCVEVIIPDVGSYWIFQGKGANGIDRLVTTTGTGAIATNTAKSTQLTLEKGCWRKAAAGENVYALYERNLTPVTVGGVADEVRFIAKIVSPYKMPTPPS